MTDETFDPVADLVRFNEKFNNDGSGGPWTVEGRPFIVEHVYRPIYSYRRWPSDPTAPPEALCEECRLAVDTWVYDAFTAPLHGKMESCIGLVGVPIINVGIDVPRQSGKTTTSLSIPFGQIYLEPYTAVSFVAAAEDQAVELVIQKLTKKIEAIPALAKITHPTDSKIIVERNQSEIEVLPASHGSATGRSKTLQQFDECRDQKARVVSATMPATFAQHGYRCPKGHTRTGARDNGEPIVECCPQMLNVPQSSEKRKCGRRLIRWHARQLFLSASGIIEDSPEKDWFRDWIDIKQKKTDRYTHTWRTDERINPKVSTDAVNAMVESFGEVPGMKDYIAVETTNTSVRKGETYLTHDEVAAIVDKNHRPIFSSALPAVMVIDSSKTGDKTSLMIFVDESKPKEQLFTRLVLAHEKVWDPKNRDDVPTGVVDEYLVLGELDIVMPRFPNILKARIDTRLSLWAKRLIHNVQQGPSELRRAWGHKLHGMDDWGQGQNSAMYMDLLTRVRGSQGKDKLIRIFPYPELERELKALRKVDLVGGGIAVYDPDADKSGRNRRKGGVHRDRAMNVAGNCLVAAEVLIEQLQGQGRITSMNKVGRLGKRTRGLSAGIKSEEY